MKKILTLIFAVASLQVACRDRHNDATSETFSESDGLRKIYIALNDYEHRHGQFPASLEDLVSEKSLKSEDIFILRSDGLHQSPEYHPLAGVSCDEILAFDYYGDGSIRTVVLVDGTVHNRK